MQLRFLGAAVVAALALPSLAAAQGAATGSISAPRPVVMVLGVYHMANPGLDRNNIEADDHLAPKRQAELEVLANQLAAFRPTKIVVEHPPSADSLLRARYEAYRAGTYTLPVSETYQIGFRLAKRLGHPRVYPADHRRDLAMDAAFTYAQQHGQMARLAPGMERVQRFVKDASERMRELTVSEILAAANTPAVDSMHGVYLQLATVGADSSYVGADVAADWYVRNLRIYANVARIAEPGDRIVVIFGSGHRPLLNEFFRQSQLFDVEEAGTYLKP